VNEGYVASKYFYSVLDTSWENTENNVRHYETPEIYWQSRMNKPHIDDYRKTEDPQTEYEETLATYMTKLQEFRETNKQWYKNRLEMVTDMESYIGTVREKTGAQPSYPAGGYLSTRSLNGIYEVNNMTY